MAYYINPQIKSFSSRTNCNVISGLYCISYPELHHLNYHHHHPMWEAAVPRWQHSAVADASKGVPDRRHDALLRPPPSCSWFCSDATWQSVMPRRGNPFHLILSKANFSLTCYMKLVVTAGCSSTWESRNLVQRKMIYRLHHISISF